MSSRDIELRRMASFCPPDLTWVCPDCDIAGCRHWRERTRRDEMSDDLFIDEDGDACLSPPGRDQNLVALPARDENGGILNPEAWAAMVDRFNAHEALTARIEALEAALQEAEEAMEGAQYDLWRDGLYTEGIEKALVTVRAGLAAGETK